jgi:hypothetical protein
MRGFWDPRCEAQPAARAGWLRIWGPFGWTEWDDTADKLIVYGADGQKTHWDRVVFGFYRRTSCTLD